MFDFPLFPPQASTRAVTIDLLFFALCLMTVVFTVIITAMILGFSIRYWKGNRVDRSNPLTHSTALEIVWTVIPLMICAPLFWAGALPFLEAHDPPDDAMVIYVIGKQWMWKVEHPGGQQEINELHVPAGRPVRLVMTSQDVIHNFFIPAFRTKQDVLPGRYTSMWFEASKPGTYHLFCAEYCGNEHAGMVGRVVVMEPVGYQRWLSGEPAGGDMATAGERLFDRHGCKTCHASNTLNRGPRLDGIFGSRVQLRSGETMTADESYLRESILRPRARIVAGYEPVMPTYEGQVTESEVMQIIEYLKSLEKEGEEDADSEDAVGAAGATDEPVEEREGRP